MFVLIVIAALPGILVAAYFIRYLLGNRTCVDKTGFAFLEISNIIILPLIFLVMFDLNYKNDCCNETAVFSPSHRLSIYVLIVICGFVYFYSASRKIIAAPICEIIINCVLLIGTVLNVYISIQIKEELLWIVGNVPIIILFVLMLARNQDLYLESLQGLKSNKGHSLERIAWKILKLSWFQKMPVLLILCLPVLLILSGLLLIFGQKPDSVIRAFTDTYRHGFSQLDYQCAGVVCDGHYLCTIAAKGHSNLVKPERYGIRGGKKIICNRQLLVSNAFEELLEQKLPRIHQPVRRLYNRVGDFVERYYGIFNYKYVSDIVYLLMKPLEWLFLLILYLFDKRPENRIAMQYLNKEDRERIKELMARSI